MLCFKEGICGYFITFVYVEGILFFFQGTDGVILFMKPRVQNRVETINCLFIHLFLKPTDIIKLLFAYLFWPGLVLLSAVGTEKKAPDSVFKSPRSSRQTPAVSKTFI